MIVKLLTRGLKQTRISWTVRTKAKKEYVRILLVLLNFRLRKKGEVVSKLIYIDTHSNACCTFFLTGPVEDGPSAKDHIFFTFLFFLFLFLQGTSIGLVQTNHALLSLVDTNLAQ